MSWFEKPWVLNFQIAPYEYILDTPKRALDRSLARFFSPFLPRIWKPTPADLIQTFLADFLAHWLSCTPKFFVLNWLVSKAPKNLQKTLRFPKLALEDIFPQKIF